MSEQAPNWISLAEARERMRTHPLRLAEVPIEHAVSMPLPTRRFGLPGFAFFAAAALRQPGKPVHQQPPDRWWVVDAAGGRVLVYALTRVAPFAEGAAWAACELPPVGGTLSELRQRQAEAEKALAPLAAAFFAGAAADAAERRAGLAHLLGLLPPPLLPQYRALAPDFFAWLES